VAVVFTALLALLPSIINGAITAYNKSKDVSIAALSTAGAIAAAQVQAMTLWIGHPLSPPSLMCYAVAIWFCKAVAIDNVLCPTLEWECSTPALKGGTAELAWIVVSGMFFSGIASIVRRGQ
jgi:hypothetical protein